MSLKRTVFLVAVGTLLFALLSATALAGAVNQTVLDEEFAKETADEQGLYDTVQATIQTAIAENAPDGGGDLPIDRSMSELAEDAVTEEYARDQTERNIERVYAFFRGDRDDLRIAIETEPLKENILAEIEAELTPIDLEALGIPQGEEMEAMADSEREFEQQQEAFRDEQKQRIQSETDDELSDAELEAILEDNMDEIREAARDEVDEEIDRNPDVDGPIEEPVRRMGHARVDALTGAISHEEYAETLTAVKSDLESALLTEIEAELDEGVPDQVELTEDVEEDELGPVETIQQAVSALSLVAIVFPALAILIVGLLAWFVSPASAALTAGAASTLAGIVGVSGGWAARNHLVPVVYEQDLPPEAADLLVAVLSGVASALTTWSAVLVAVGIVALAVGIAIHRELIP